MENKIAITGDLADLFIALSLKEDYCSYFTGFDDKGHGDYILENLARIGCNYNDLLSRLTHLLLLYDKIDLPILNSSYFIKGEMKSIAAVKHNVPIGFSKSHWVIPFYDEDFFPKTLYPRFKPIIINFCMHYANTRFFSEYAIDTTGSVDNFFSYLFDRFFYREGFEVNDRIETDAESLLIYVYKDEDYPLTANAERIHTALGILENALRNCMLIRAQAKEGPCDFYTPGFSDFHNTTNTDDAYCILKTQISKVIQKQPALESLTDILRFREERHHDILLLRNEVSNLESLLIQGGREKAIQKAFEDVKRANQSLLIGTKAKDISKISTYLGLPLGAIEFLTLGTPFSLIISAAGTTAQLVGDYSDYKNNWLFVAR